MARYFQVARPRAPLHLYYSSFDNVVHIAVADGAVLALSVIYRAEYGLNFRRLLRVPSRRALRGGAGRQCVLWSWPTDVLAAADART